MSRLLQGHCLKPSRAFWDAMNFLPICDQRTVLAALSGAVHGLSAPMKRIQRKELRILVGLGLREHNAQ